MMRKLMLGKIGAQRIGMALIGLLFAINVYRAAIQSCTVDEAFTFNEFASKPLSRILTAPYDANNQVLHTILCHWVMQFFGVSELTLRMASLLGGLLFMVMCYRLCRLYFGTSWLFLSTLGLLILNPFTLDYLSVARGYGLAAGLLLLAIDQLSRVLLEGAWEERRLARASFALGLSVAANLTFAVPAIALVLIFLHLEMWEGRGLRFWDAVNHLILPGATAALLILLLPLIGASRDNFYFGAKTFRSAIASVATPMLVHHETALAPMGRLAMPAVPLLLGACTVFLVASMLAATSRSAAEWPRRMPLLLNGGVLGMSCGIVFLAHQLTGLLYPHSRTGLYLVVELTISAACGILFSRGSRFSSTLSIVAGLAAIPLLVLFLGQITVGPYQMWVFDSGTKKIVNLIRSDVVKTRARTVRVGANHYLQPSLNFYRRRYHIKELARIEDAGPDVAAEYYVLMPQESYLLKSRSLEVLYRDPVSSQILAKSKKAQFQQGG